MDSQRTPFQESSMMLAGLSAVWSAYVPVSSSSRLTGSLSWTCMESFLGLLMLSLPELNGCGSNVSEAPLRTTKNYDICSTDKRKLFYYATRHSCGLQGQWTKMGRLRGKWKTQTMSGISFYSILPLSLLDSFSHCLGIKTLKNFKTHKTIDFSVYFFSLVIRFLGIPRLIYSSDEVHTYKRRYVFCGIVVA